jgi:hypothetical protein
MVAQTPLEASQGLVRHSPMAIGYMFFTHAHVKLCNVCAFEPMGDLQPTPVVKIHLLYGQFASLFLTH